MDGSGSRGRMRPSWRLLHNRLLCDTLLYPYGVWRQRRLRREAPRSQVHTFTCFHRSPLQLEALLGPVLAFLASGDRRVGPLEILVFACSTGAEVYTLASVLQRARPELDFRIRGSDLHAELVERASAGRYSLAEVRRGRFVTAEFIQHTFDRDGDEYVVRPALRARTSFATANLLDPELGTRFGPADIVFAQSVLSHLVPAQAAMAFANLHRCLRPRAALFIRGMDLDLRTQLTRQYQLAPLAWRCRAIHEEGRQHASSRWWSQYYASEPYSLLRRDRLRRFGTIFLRQPD